MDHGYGCGSVQRLFVVSSASFGVETVIDNLYKPGFSREMAAVFLKDSQPTLFHVGRGLSQNSFKTRYKGDPKL